MTNVFLGRDYTNQLRGFAMLIIMVGHIGGFFGDRPFIGLPIRFYTPLGGVGTALFLIISGYGLSESYKKNGLSGYWRKKGYRLIVPYLLSIPLFYVVAFLSPIMHHEIMTMMPNHWYFEFMWFVEYLVIWYVVFYVVHRFLPSKLHMPFMFLMGVISFFMLKSTLMTAQSFSFVLGEFLSQYKGWIEKHLMKRNVCLLALLSCFIGVLFLAIKQFPMIRSYPLESYLYRFVELMIYAPIALGLLNLFSLVKITDKGILVFVGSISYELYLVHVPFLYGISQSYTYVAIFFVQCFLHAYILNKMSTYVIKITDKFIA